MNKVQVGKTQSPNIKQVRSKIGSLQNASHKPKGGDFKIENKKLEWKTGSRTSNFNESYTPKGGDKKVKMELIIQSECLGLSLIQQHFFAEIGACCQTKLHDIDRESKNYFY